MFGILIARGEGRRKYPREEELHGKGQKGGTVGQGQRREVKIWKGSDACRGRHKVKVT